MQKINNIAKNTSYFTSALILQKIISFSFFIILAKFLLPEDLGKYYFAISFTTIFAIFIDLGLANVLTREVAKTKERAEELLGSVLVIKIPLTVLSVLAVFLIINLMNYPEITRYLVYLSVINMVLDSFTLTFFSIIRGFHNLIYESIASVIFQLIALTFGILALKYNLGLLWLMMALVFASIYNFFYSLSLVRLKFKLKFRLKINKKLIKTIIYISIPFGIYGILQRLYMYLDTVFLSIFAGDHYVGLYQVSFKVIFALQFLPMAFMAALYPAFSAYWKENREQLVISFERAMSYLIVISIPISIGIIMLADKIILLFKPEYLEAVLPLQIIMISLAFLFINFPVGSLLNACDKQKINTINMGITLIVSIILNLILIPKWQTTGASITVVATNMLMFILGMRWVPTIIKYRPKKIIYSFLKSFIAGIIMAILIYYLKEELYFVWVIFAGGIVYFLTLFLIGGFRKEDVASIFNSFIKKSK